MGLVLAMDISGNFKEGKGTTGICYLEDGQPIKLDELKASDYDSDVEYWDAHVSLIQFDWPDHLVIEGYKLYNHKGKNASMQANSELETPQLKGVIKHACYMLNIPCHVQFASEVKTRWSDKVLQATGYLDSNNKFKGQATNNHKRDALRHAIHFEWYGRKKYESKND